MNRELSIAVMVAAELFQSRKWHYAGGQGFYVPDVEKIAELVEELAAEVRHGPTTTLRTGRLQAQREHGDDVRILFDLGLHT